MSTHPHTDLTNVDSTRRPRLVIHSETVHPRVRSFNALFKGAREVTIDTAVTGREDDSGNALVDVEVVEEVGVLVEEGVGGMGGEVERAAVKSVCELGEKAGYFYPVQVGMFE